MQTHEKDSVWRIGSDAQSLGTSLDTILSFSIDNRQGHPPNAPDYGHGSTTVHQVPRYGCNKFSFTWKAMSVILEL
jgi:hypothetical protein